MRPQLQEDIGESYQRSKNTYNIPEVRPQLQEDFYETSTDLEYTIDN
tara:strand:- start:153 stop:293 length:141 start_codon:yes stop_codon:yes gene_type:complete